MSKISCNVNKDLLPLYVDDVCSEESKSMVEEHLAECEQCQEYYDALREGIPTEKIDEEKEGLLSEENMRQAAVSVIKETKKEISKSQVRKVAVVMAAFICVLFVLEGLSGSFMGGWLGKIPIFDLRLKVGDVHVTEMYQLENGYLYITVESDKESRMCYAGNQQEILDKKEGFTGEYEGVFGLQNVPLDINAIGMKSCTFIFPLSREVRESNGEIRKREDSAIYLEGKGDKRIKVWEKGQKVEKAPLEIEAKAKREIEERDTDWEGKILKGEITVEEAAENAAGDVYIIMELNENPRKKSD